jgi:hypothetical protein
LFKIPLFVFFVFRFFLDKIKMERKTVEIMDETTLHRRPAVGSKDGSGWNKSVKHWGQRERSISSRTLPSYENQGDLIFPQKQ